MANVLPKEKQIAVISALAEGSGIRQIERITGVHRDTIMRLGIKVGQGCAAIMDYKMRDLPCELLQFDEIWGFIGKKQRHLVFHRLSQAAHTQPKQPQGSRHQFMAAQKETSEPINLLRLRQSPRVVMRQRQLQHSSDRHRLGHRSEGYQNGGYCRGTSAGR